MQDNERIIELIAKSLDESLTPQEQALVNEAMQNSLAIRVAAEGLKEFDGLLKRTGMAIPEEGFPLRVLARLEAYELRRTRLQWLFTVAVIFLGLFAALVWFALNAGAIASAGLLLVANGLVFIPFLFAVAIAVLNYMGNGPLLIFAVGVLAFTLVWARVSGGWGAAPVRDVSASR